MNKQIVLTLLLFLLYTLSLCAQDTIAGANSNPKKFKLNPWENINGYRFSAGYIKDLELEASYLITSYPEKDPGFGGFAMLVHYLGAGAEYVKDGPRNAVGAKLSYEASFSILAAQLGTDYLITDKDQQLRIMPKVGLSLFGMLTIYYGRNYNMLTKSSLQPYKHIVTLQLNLYDFLISDNK